MNTLAAFFVLVTIGSADGHKFHGEFKTFSDCNLVARAMSMTHDSARIEVCIPYDSALSIGYKK